MFKYRNTIFCLLLLSTLLVSCEKVMDLKLQGTDKKIVIDARLTNEPGGCMVYLSHTQDFNTTNDFQGISGAEIILQDETGLDTALSETAPGMYSHSQVVGQPGKTYNLSVKVNGQNFQAKSTMPEWVNFDSIYTTREFFFDEEETFATVIFQDPVGIRNYYRFLHYVNGKKSKGYFLMDDDLSDGKRFESTLYFFPEEKEDSIKTGDEIMVEMQCIDAAVYKYWYSLEQGASGSGQSAAPANPVSNIEGGALGYFSAQTVQIKKAYVP